LEHCGFEVAGRGVQDFREGWLGDRRIETTETGESVFATWEPCDFRAVTERLDTGVGSETLA